MIISDITSLSGKYFSYGYKNILHPGRKVYEFCKAEGIVGSEILLCKDCVRGTYRHISFQTIKDRIEVFEDYDALQKAHLNWLCEQ